MHYAEVADIRILKCPTLTNYFFVVFHPGGPQFCEELYELPSNLEKKKKIKEKLGEKSKKGKGCVCESQDWSQESKVSKKEFCSFSYFLQRNFEAKLIKLDSESDIFLCMAVNLNVRLSITTST